MMGDRYEQPIIIGSNKRRAKVCHSPKRHIPMKFALAALLLLHPLLSTFAQESVDRAIIAKICDEGLNRLQAHNFFTHFTEVIGPRLTATPVYKDAVEYAQGKFKEWGSMKEDKCYRF
jgi:hypothetical protein